MRAAMPGPGVCQSSGADGCHGYRVTAPARSITAGLVLVGFGSDLIEFAGSGGSGGEWSRDYARIGSNSWRRGSSGNTLTDRIGQRLNVNLNTTTVDHDNGIKTWFATVTVGGTTFATYARAGHGGDPRGVYRLDVSFGFNQLPDHITVAVND